MYPHTAPAMNDQVASVVLALLAGIGRLDARRGHVEWLQVKAAEAFAHAAGGSVFGGSTAGVLKESEDLLRAAGAALGHCRAASAREVQSALIQRGHRDLARDVERTVRGRNSIAHPSPALKRHVLAALGSDQHPEVKATEVPMAHTEEASHVPVPMTQEEVASTSTSANVAVMNPSVEKTDKVPKIHSTRVGHNVNEESTTEMHHQEKPAKVPKIHNTVQHVQAQVVNACEVPAQDLIMPSANATFNVGDLVQLVGLTSARGLMLNGAIVPVTEPTNINGRVGVCIDGQTQVVKQDYLIGIT